MQSIQAADLNEDGLPDLILNARTGLDPGGSVKVFTGLPTGEFKGIPESPFSGAAADSVRSLDLNRDGRQDLLAIFADSAAVLINQGRGQFAKIPTVYSFGTGFSAGVYTDTFDTNDDGFPDLVFDQGDGQIGVLLNATDGSFSSLRISSPITIAQRMVSADWNGDGRSDMLSVSSLGSLDFLINQGNGSFAVFPNKLGSLSADARLIPVDFDSDKKIDLIAYSGGQTLSFRNVSQ